MWGLREQRRALICAPGKAKLSVSPSTDRFSPSLIRRAFLELLACSRGFLRYIETDSRASRS